MYSGHPPYRIKDSDYENKRRTALIENPYYKMFVLEQYEEIWQDYSNRKSHRDDPTFYSEDFKNFINLFFDRYRFFLNQYRVYIGKFDF